MIKEPLIVAVIGSCAIAFFEYVFQVPANRIGSNYFSLTQLKIMQECITLIVFTVFAFLVFREPLRWNNVVSYVLLIGAVGFAFFGQDDPVFESSVACRLSLPSGAAVVW
jgi:uncharacterized protein (DUF486 family)